MRPREELAGFSSAVASTEWLTAIAARNTARVRAPRKGARAHNPLKTRFGKVAAGLFIGPNEEALSFDDIADALVTDY